MTIPQPPVAMRHPTTFRCPYCAGETLRQSLEVREMMFGSGERSQYWECASCGALRITEVPRDLPRHYPREYYAYSEGGCVTWRDALACRVALGEARWLRPALVLHPSVRHYLAIHPLAALRRHDVRREARIADVGGGAGFLARTLHRIGFTQVTVVDPYLEANRTIDGVRFLKNELGEVSETFDVIMYHHAFEHITDPDQELRAVRDHLAPNGLLLLRVPVLPCDAFARYGTDWVQLDAPRHMTIPSPQGIDLLARRVGLTVIASGRDSSDLQFWGSEAYRRGLSLKVAPRPVGAQRRRLQREADRLNAQGIGDQGWFLLRAHDTR